MSHKVAGFIFILFGAGVLGDSVQALYNGHIIEMNLQGLKPILTGFLGIASCIYGYKRTKTRIEPPQS